MGQRSITESDRDLIHETTETLENHFEPGRHRTACGLRTSSGATYTSVNLITSIGAAQVHCEPITIGMAVMDGETDFATTVAVTYPENDPTREPQVVSPCGVCRELLRDLAPEIDAIVPGDDGPEKIDLSELLPAK